MPSEMFGSPIGEIAARELELKESMGAANIASLAAHAQLYDAQAQKMHQETAAQRKLAEAFERRRQARVEATLSPPAEMAKRRNSSDFWEAAEDAAAVGQFEMSRKLADTASLVDKREADEQASWARGKKEQFTNRKNELEVIQGALRSVKDPTSFDQVNRWYKETFGRESPVAGQTYSPELIKRLAASVITEKAQIELDLRKVDTYSKVADRSSAIDTRRQRLNLEERRTAAQEDREKRLAKNDGKPIAGASKADVTAAAQMVLNSLFPDKQFDDLGEDTQAELTLGARAIADEAKKLQRNNPALTRTEAIAQAFANSKRDGDWDMLKRSMFDPREDAVKFKGLGKTPMTPMTLPEKADALIAGRYYQNAKGQTAKYLGNGKFQGVSAADLAAQGGGSSENALEDEDEE